MNTKKIAVGVAALVAGGGLALGLSQVAMADPSTGPSVNPSTGASGAPKSKPAKGTEVTGDEATKVAAAVTAKDSSITVSKVVKVADGSYRVMGTKDGAKVGVTVSADLATVSDAKAAPQGKGGRGGKGGGQHTAASADETAKATAAVTSKDSAVTVTKVEKDADGTFDVIGTKNGATVKFDVSADFQTVSDAQTGGKGGGKHTPASADETTKATAAVTAKDSAVTVTKVMKDADGSFDVAGTKDGKRVMFEVSADFQTATQRTR